MKVLIQEIFDCGYCCYLKDRKSVAGIICGRTDRIFSEEEYQAHMRTPKYIPDWCSLEDAEEVPHE